MQKDEDAVGKKHASQKKVIRDYEKYTLLYFCLVISLLPILHLNNLVLRIIYRHLLWRLHSVSQRSIEFAFFSGTFVISVQFETEWNSSPYAKVASYSVRSVISNGVTHLSWPYWFQSDICKLYLWNEIVFLSEPCLSCFDYRKCYKIWDSHIPDDKWLDEASHGNRRFLEQISWFPVIAAGKWCYV